MDYKVTFGYLGKYYYGFAKQIGKLTIQDELENAFSKILRKEIKVQGAARTDTGVNAHANVVGFNSCDDLDLYRLRWAINSILPEDIQVSSIKKMPNDFNPRREAKSRVYSYYIINRKYNSIFHKDVCYHYAKELSVSNMKQAADYLRGHHNFRSFSSYMANEKTYTREVKVLKLESSSDFFDVRKEDLIKITIEADSFLYNMVRIIVGTLLEVGLGKREPSSMKKVLAAKNRLKAGKTAPAHGLFLVRVKY